MNITKKNIEYKTWKMLFQFLTTINTQSFMNIVLASRFTFHDVENIVKHSLMINEWRVKI
jgi:hypothetical protein